MITTVTLNPCNDLTINIPSFVYGGMNRVSSQSFDLAGKGFNVARGISRLGEKSAATGFLYHDNGKITQDSLESENVFVDCIWTAGKIRTNTKLFDQKKRVVTEINEPGVIATPEDIQQVINKIVELAKKSSYLVLSGSLAPKMPEDTYGKIINLCNQYCKTILDAEGKKLLFGIEQKPFMIKPNLFELETAVNRELPTNQEIKQASLEIINNKGVSIVAVSLGEKGLIISDKNQSIYAPAIKNIKVLGTVGAGDSMVAAFCVALSKNLSLEDMCKMGVAAATSCVIQEGTGLVTKSGLEQMLERVEIIKI